MPQAPYLLGPNFQELDRLNASDEFELQAQIRNTLRLLRPQRAVGFQKKRFGSANDGGYVLLDDFEGVDAALSLGIERNIDWDCAVADRGLRVYQFDHTVDAPAPDDPRMIFSRTMIAPEAAEGAETLESIVFRLDKGHVRPNLMLKMDIECAEWPVLEATSLDAISRFSQITCELHHFMMFAHLEWRQTFFRGLRKLSKFYAPVHIHANNYAGWVPIAGIAVPAVLEVTFANRSIYPFDTTDELFPGSLDAPCDPTRADMFLGNFVY